MDANRRVKGGLLALVGFLLSPLSWWNDLFVNVPLAFAFAWIVSLFSASASTASFVIGYWLTNVLGLVLMQKGAKMALTNLSSSYSRKILSRICPSQSVIRR